MSPMTPGTGGVLGGRYTLTERIAAGGMGDVWAATDRVLGRSVAIKIMRPNTTDEGNFAARFRDESEPMARPARIVTVEAIPRTASGKVIRAELTRTVPGVASGG